MTKRAPAAKRSSFKWGGLGGVLVLLPLAIGWPLLAGAPLDQIVLSVAGGLLAGAVAGLLPQKALMPVLALGLLASLVLVPTQNGLVAAAAFSWAAGVVISATLRSNVILASRTPRKPVRISWDEGSARRSKDSPGWTEVEARLQELDGRMHTMASLHREDRRLDVCCPEAGRYWVIHTEPGARRPNLNQAFTGQPDTGGEVSARIGGMDFHYSDHLFVDLLTVLAAARWFWENDGSRNPSLTWDQDTNRHEVLIPPPVGELD